MKGIVNNFRQGRHTIYHNHMIISVDNVDSREKADKLVGREVTFKTQTGKTLKGKVASAHGNSGCIRVIFEKGLPGQSIGQKVEIN